MWCSSGERMFDFIFGKRRQNTAAILRSAGKPEKRKEIRDIKPMSFIGLCFIPEGKHNFFYLSAFFIAACTQSRHILPFCTNQVCILYIHIYIYIQRKKSSSNRAYFFSFQGGSEGDRWWVGRQARRIYWQVGYKPVCQTVASHQPVKSKQPDSHTFIQAKQRAWQPSCQSNSLSGKGRKKKNETFKDSWW